MYTIFYREMRQERERMEKKSKERDLIDLYLFIRYVKKIEFVTLLYSQTARLLLIYSLLIKWTEDPKQYSVIQYSVIQYSVIQSS